MATNPYAFGGYDFLNPGAHLYGMGTPFGPQQQFFGGGGPRQNFVPQAPPIDPATGLPMGQVQPPGAGGGGSPFGGAYDWNGGAPPFGVDAGGNPMFGFDDGPGGRFGPAPGQGGAGLPPGFVDDGTDQRWMAGGGPNELPGQSAVQPGFFGGGGPKQDFTPQAPGIDPATGLPMGQVGPGSPPLWMNADGSPNLGYQPTGDSPTMGMDQGPGFFGAVPPGGPNELPGQSAVQPGSLPPWMNPDGSPAQPIAATPPTAAPAPPQNNAFDPWAPGGYFASRRMDTNGMSLGGGAQGQSQPGQSGYPMVPAAPPGAQGQQPNSGQQGGNVPSTMVNQNTNGQPLSNGQAGGQGWSPNPYLTQQAQGILGSVTDNLRNNILPGVRASMRAAGGYGDSRTGIAEGMAMQGANTSASNALANLLGSSYESDMNRGLQRYGIDTGASTSRYNTDVGAGVTMRGQDLNQVLGLGNLNLGQQRLGLDTELGRGQLGLGQARLGLDTELGRGQLALGGRNADISQQGVNNALTLGLGNLGLGYHNADINQMLGLGGLGIQQQQADTSRIGTMGNLQLGNRNADINQLLGLGNLGVAQQQANTARDLGWGNLGLGYYGADTNRLLGLGQLGLGQQAQDTNRFTAQNNAGIGWGNLALGNRQADNSYNLGLGNLALGNRNTDLAGQRLGYDMFTGGVNNAINWNNALYNLGQANLNAPMGPINQANPFLQNLMAATGSGNVTMPGQGGGWSGAVGGALGATQLYRLLFGGG